MDGRTPPDAPYAARPPVWWLGSRSPAPRHSKEQPHMSLWTNILERSALRSRERRAEVSHREAMRALQEALSAAASAQKTRDEFLARMSHELRTPLNAVIGLSRVLEKNSAGNLRTEDIHLLGRVRAGGEQVLRLVE